MLVSAETVSLTLPPEVVETIAQRVADILAERVPANGVTSPYFTVAEAADYLRAKPQRVYDLLSAHRLTRYRDGRRVLVARSELEAHMQRSQHRLSHQTAA
jgi:excisionase family DNA binding protein